MREQLRLGSRLNWLVVWVLAAAAPAVYILWPSDAMWWLAPVLVVPLIGLAEWRREQRGFAIESYGIDGSAPWGPP
jgi:hypothetical protein